MAGPFSATARLLLKWTGFDRSKLPKPWQGAVEKFTGPGGGAEQRLSKVKSAKILDVNGNPVHQSHFNPEDKRWIVSVELECEKRNATCHVFPNGVGTTRKGEDPS